MKKISYKIILAISILVAGLYGCEEEFVGQPATDSSAPGKVTGFTVENLPGGGRISYDLPADDDLLYVKAIYTINGVEKNATASLYEKSLEIKGFGTTDEQTVTLYSVDRSNNYSDPVEVKIQPTTPPVQLIYESLSMERSFGGVKIGWENEYQGDVAIHLIAVDSIGDFSVADVVYTNAVEGAYNLRGFDDTDRLFGAYVRDRWDNYSDTLSGTYKPFFELELDKSLWARETLVGDNTSQLGGSWAFSKMFDEITGNQGWHTSSGKTPMLFTLDLGVTTKLSRYTLWHRLENWPYTHHNPKKWKVYGTADLEQIRLAHDDADEEYWTGGFQSDPNWTLMYESESLKPSGDGPNTQEDLDFANQGFEFEFPLEAPPVRYIRILVESTWSSGDMLHISELSFWGEKPE